jgi:hypothetical protein
MQWSGYYCKVFHIFPVIGAKTKKTPCKVCLRHQERNTEEKSEPECATTLEQVRVTTGSKQSHSVEPNLMNSFLSIDVCPFFFAHCDVCPSILIGEA